jgi:hypothetical protein
MKHSFQPLAISGLPIPQRFDGIYGGGGGASQPPPSPQITASPFYASGIDTSPEAMADGGSRPVGHAFQPYSRDDHMPTFDSASCTGAAVMEDHSGDGRPLLGPCTESPMLTSEVRHALDMQVGVSSTAIYDRMCEVQHFHRPAYHPESPYVKYRRYSHTSKYNVASTYHVHSATVAA